MSKTSGKVLGGAAGAPGTGRALRVRPWRPPPSYILTPAKQNGGSARNMQLFKSRSTGDHDCFESGNPVSSCVLPPNGCLPSLYVNGARELLLAHLSLQYRSKVRTHFFSFFKTAVEIGPVC